MLKPLIAAGTASCISRAIVRKLKTASFCSIESGPAVEGMAASAKTIIAAMRTKTMILFTSSTSNVEHEKRQRRLIIKGVSIWSAGAASELRYGK